MTSAPVIPILVGGFFVWSIYRRVRRSIGRQPLRPRRAITSLIILSLFSLWIVSISLQKTNLLLGFGGGLLPGALLGLLGLRLTRFETTGDGHFYRPNTHIGVAISLLFIGRMLYRFWVLRDITTEQNYPPPFQSALTLFIFGLTAGYYLVYQTGLLIHSRDKKNFKTGV